MISYQIMTKRYKELQRKHKNLKQNHAKEIRHKNKNIDLLRAKVIQLTEEDTKKSKLIREKDLIIGEFLKRSNIWK